MSDPTRGGLPPLTGDPTKDFAGGALPPLTGDPSKDFSATGDQALHAEYKSGALAKRMQAANRRDQENLADETASTPSPLVQGLQRGAAAVLSDAQAIPGVERAEAALGAAGSHIPGLTPAGGPLDYAGALNALRSQTSQIPAAARVAGQLATGALAFGALPQGVTQAVSPAASGAIAGGLQGALSADQESTGQRIYETAKDAALGGLVGKVLDLGATLVRAKAAPSLYANDTARKAAIAASDEALYGRAAQEGTNAVNDEAAQLAQVDQAMANARNAGKQLALPAPGQSDVARAQYLDARPLRMNGRFASPPALPETLEQAASRDYTNVLGEPTPAETTPFVYDYTNPRPLLLRGANDMGVRVEPQAPEAPSGGGGPTALANLRQTLMGPTLGDYTNAVRSSPRFADADAPTVAQEVYRQLSADQRALQKGIAADPMNFKPASGIKLSDIIQAKQDLLSAADPVMPSFREAVGAHAELAGQRQAFVNAANAAKQAMGHALPNAAKLQTTSLDAALARISQSSPDQAQAALEGILGRIGSRPSMLIPHPTTIWNLPTGFGIPRTIASSNALMNLVRTADQAAGGSVAPNLQAIITALAAQQAHP